MNERILIVGTVPYNEKSTSRAFESYFYGMSRENLAQIFSNTKTPTKGHCSTLYQITDQRLLKRRFNSKIKTGKIYNYENLVDSWRTTDLEIDSKIISKMYSIGKHKNSIIYLIRKIIWKRKYWCTPELNKWLEDFQPNCVFLSFSDDFFIPEIALYVAEKFNIPIISSIGDDYYFNYNKSISLFYHIYKLKYRALIRRVFQHRGSAIFIGNKIRDKYNKEFGLNGETVYLSSSIKRRDFKQINPNNLIVSYFGNIRLGRNKSLNEIANALKEINPIYKLHIYSNEDDSSYYKILINNENVEYHGSVPYSVVQKKTLESDILILVEGFKKKDVDITRYSLSTKVADSLASGVSIFAYGSVDCGAIEYAIETGCIVVCKEKNNLVKTLQTLIFDKKLQYQNYIKELYINDKNKKIKKSSAIFQNIVNKVCEEN